MVLLGNLKLERLPIFSFLIKNPETGYYLHYNFVNKLLNDLFGIQSRSGCACAGPYGFYLLGISEEVSQNLMKVLEKKNDSEEMQAIFKPGFTRFNIPFFLEQTQIDFIHKSVQFVCEHAWK
jgi:selenocysteine lyase/cysteine desulfurase